MEIKKSYICLLKILVVTFPILLGMLLTGCSSSHILHQKTEGDQNFIYIDFQRNHKPFEIEESLNKGQVKNIKILEFEGDKILVEFAPEKNNLSLSITGKGFDVKDCSDNMKIVLIRERECIISIAVSAISSGEYTLKITKL